jgi:hypothetical protein
MIFKIKNSGDIRFYLYVSDAKINMLFEQIYSTQKRNTHREMTVKLGPVTGTGGASRGDTSPDRDDKLRAVESFLIEQNLVGTPEEPKAYFKGILPMRRGLYNDLELRPEGCRRHRIGKQFVSLALPHEFSRTQFYAAIIPTSASRRQTPGPR